MRIDNNQQNLTFKANILVQGTKNIEAAKRLAKPAIKKAHGLRGHGYIIGSDSVLVVDKRTKEGREAQVAYHNMKRSFRSGSKQQAQQRKLTFDEKLATAKRTAKTMDYRG